MYNYYDAVKQDVKEWISDEAEKALAGNWELIQEAREEFGDTRDILELGAEACDVAIRCYLLSSAIADVLDEMVLTET